MPDCGVQNYSVSGFIIRSRPGKPNQRKGDNEKFMNFAHFCVNSGVFSLGKQARFTLNFCSGMPLRKVHELAFLWFGLPEWLLILFLRDIHQDWAGWGIIAVIPGNPRRTKGHSQHLEARPGLQDWPRSELFTVKKFQDRALFEVFR